MTTKICLIRPSIVVPARNQTTIFSPPLGLAYIAGALREAGFDVQFIDAVGASLDTRHAADYDCYLYGLSPRQTIERIPPGTDIIGIGIGFSFEWPTCRELVNGIRKKFPDALLLGGGEHVTAIPDQVMRDSALDIGVLGEGEETAVEIARAFEAGTLDLSEILGIAYVSPSGEVIQNDRRPRKRDLDAIAWPAWDLIPLENYLARGYGFGVNRGRSMPMMASRGCPYQCTFCSNPAMWTTRWLPRDPDLLLDEMQHYQKTYNVENFDFYDLTAIVKKSWIVDFCHKIEERGMTFTWQLPSGTRTEAIDGDVASLLYRSGCRNMSYSPESGSPAVLNRIKKKIHPDSVISSISEATENGMNIKCNIIFGFPKESMSEIFESYRFIARMAWAGAFDISIWAFSPYPGSELFDEIFDTRQLTLNDDYYDSLRAYADTSSTVSYSEHISDRRLKVLRTAGVAFFYLVCWTRRPYRPFKMIWHLLQGKQESRSEQGLANLMNRSRIQNVEPAE